MGHTRTRGHKCLLYDGAWRPLELHWLSSRAHRIAWFVPNYWWCWKQTILIYFEIQPQPTFQEGMLERTLKEWIQPEMTREFLPQQSHEVWSEEARNTHISNTLRAVDDQRPIFQQYPAISSNGVSSHGGLVLNHVHPRRDPFIIPVVRTPDVAWLHHQGTRHGPLALSCSPCADGPTWGGAKDRWWGTLFPQPEWLFRWDTEGLKTRC